MVGELLAQPGHVLGIARQPVERLAYNDVDLARFHRAQQLPEPGTVAPVPRQFRVKPRRYHGAAKIADQRRAGRDLISAR
ncbi:hypothetical protein ASE77_18810 [Sphingomonas sp. Leaf226]|nr:hypothetical protein ASE77_18810 [Sphingomonas sp. Leaf226]